MLQRILPLPTARFCGNEKITPNLSCGSFSVIIGGLAAQVTILAIGLIASTFDMTINLSYESVLPVLLVEALIVSLTVLYLALKRIFAK